MGLLTGSDALARVALATPSLAASASSRAAAAVAGEQMRPRLGAARNLGGSR
eukprot:CAMPEP_0180815098 /NCGR_PEP_ID=MMETSP1038_2-20121128/67431_1 /TAXON_ID=632150 /ORGANISM="Azadinium spinosum, Strain 3D9" /LENGTH=51 /DNA_ID=CAMNT_0022856821 /DNA_START=124 /DNA_END=277 /DNA_ORIENTATION=+